MGNYPTTIPKAFTKHEDLEDAYRRGWNHGHGIACHNVPTLGETYWLDGEGKLTADVENIREVHLHLCHAAADNSRCYSPFEFLAHEFNERPSEYEEREEGDDTPSREAMWYAFEEGTADAIAADLNEYDDEAYGIEPDQDEDEEPEDLTGLDAIDLVNRLLDAYSDIDEMLDNYMGSGDGTAEERARQRRSNLTYISVQNAVLALIQRRREPCK